MFVRKALLVSFMCAVVMVMMFTPVAVAQSSFSSDDSRSGMYRPGAKPGETTIPTPVPNLNDEEPGVDDEQQDNNAINYGPLFHRSDGFHWLEKPGMLVPGGGVINVRTNGLCTAAYIVHNVEGSFMFTAGHCGRVGDRIGVESVRGRIDQVGTVVFSEFAGAGGRDIALVKITDMSKVQTALANNDKHQDYPGAGQKIIGWAGAEWLQKHKPYVCRMGQRTGISCGNFVRMVGDDMFSFVAVSDHGDSGGPVYAVTPRGLVAVGVTSYKMPYDAGKTTAMLIEDVMASRGLELNG